MFVTGRLNIIKMSILLKATDSSQSLSKSQMAFFTKIEKFILKFMWGLERPSRANTILKKKKNKILENTL